MGQAAGTAAGIAAGGDISFGEVDTSLLQDTLVDGGAILPANLKNRINFQ